MTLETRIEVVEKAETMMLKPTKSESLSRLDCLCKAMIAIGEELMPVE